MLPVPARFPRLQGPSSFPVPDLSPLLGCINSASGRGRWARPVFPSWQSQMTSALSVTVPRLLFSFILEIASPILNQPWFTEDLVSEKVYMRVLGKGLEMYSSVVIKHWGGDKQGLDKSCPQQPTVEWGVQDEPRSLALESNVWKMLVGDCRPQDPKMRDSLLFPLAFLVLLLPLCFLLALMTQETPVGKERQFPFSL